MLYQLLQSMFSTVFPGTADSVQREEKRTILPDGHEKRVKSAASVDSIAEDIKRLEAEYGHLTEGMSLTVELKQLLVLCPRSRRRKDSYKKLQKVLLRDKGVILTIKSQKG
jgi:hypothetical protein